MAYRHMRLNLRHEHAIDLKLGGARGARLDATQLSAGQKLLSTCATACRDAEGCVAFEHFTGGSGSCFFKGAHPDLKSEDSSRPRDPAMSAMFLYLPQSVTYVRVPGLPGLPPASKT